MIINQYTLAAELTGLRQEKAEAQSQVDRLDGAIQVIEQLIEMAKQPEPILPLSFTSYVKPGDNPPDETVSENEDDPEDKPE